MIGMTAEHESKLSDLLENIGIELEQYIRRCVPESDAGDVLQNAFIVMAKKFDRFLKADGGREKTEQDFRQWAYKITYYEILSQRKRNRRHGHEDIAIIDWMVPSASDEIGEAASKITFYQIISGLNDKEKAVIESVMVKDLSFQEISEQTGEGISAIKMRYHRAKKKLQKKFRNNL